MTSMASTPPSPTPSAVANPAVTAPDLRLARFIRLEKPVAIPDPQTLKLDNAAFGATNYMREILGYAPVQPDGSVVIQVPAYVAFQISILDATGKRISPVHDAWLQVTPGETVHCNGCHTPAAQQRPLPGQTAHSHGRAGVFASAYAGGNASIPFTNSQSSFTTITGTTEPLVPTTTGRDHGGNLERRQLCRGYAALPAGHAQCHALLYGPVDPAAGDTAGHRSTTFPTRSSVRPSPARPIPPMWCGRPRPTSTA